MRDYCDEVRDLAMLDILASTGIRVGLYISGIEIRLREIGRKLNITKVHPHKFRITLATRAIDKGMPIEQVQVLLGHTKIDTTLQYVMISQKILK